MKEQNKERKGRTDTKMANGNQHAAEEKKLWRKTYSKMRTNRLKQTINKKQKEDRGKIKKIKMKKKMKKKTEGKNKSNHDSCCVPDCGSCFSTSMTRYGVDAYVAW
jgi:hypothetical protein